MKKFECNPCPDAAEIGQIEVTVELTDEEIEKIRLMDEDEYSEFIKSRATVTITDWEVDYVVPPLADWEKKHD